ncbi:circadian clock-controlled protein daywake-like [Euwallacea fornicatus]|uniref:circadian clock-controlled protein daywake-like n=1 Tax=Euwallacea fornicatus TaxID=995702 RepID=UPI003390353A
MFGHCEFLVRAVLCQWFVVGAWGRILETQPDFVKTCMITKPWDEFVNCSTNAVQHLFSEIPKGNKDIELQVLDPLQIPAVKILQGGGGPVAVNATLTQVSVVGFGNTKILYNSVDPETYDFFTKLHLPRLRLDGNYELLGRILVIALRGKGNCWFDAKDLDIAVKSEVKMEKRSGFHFFKVNRVHVQFSIGGLKLYLGNLFDGIKPLEDSTNAYLNSNWRPVAESINPILSKTIEDIMLDILQKVFDNIPADFFLGDIDANEILKGKQP